MSISFYPVIYNNPSIDILNEVYVKVRGKIFHATKSTEIDICLKEIKLRTLDSGGHSVWTDIEHGWQSIEDLTPVLNDRSDRDSCITFLSKVSMAAEKLLTKRDLDTPRESPAISSISSETIPENLPTIPEEIDVAYSDEEFDPEEVVDES